MAVRTWSVTANPTEYSTLRPRLVSWPVSQSSSPCEAPAPSARTSSFFRCTARTWAIAADRTAMWSAVVLEPALPGRSVAASISWVLSHQTPIGWYPNPPLNVAAAFSFSECTVTKVASTSSTTVSPRSVPATFEVGTPPALG